MNIEMRHNRQGDISGLAAKDATHFYTVYYQDCGIEYFETQWQRDLTAFIRRDLVPPSVIMWSTRKEIAEIRRKTAATFYESLYSEVTSYRQSLSNLLLEL